MLTISSSTPLASAKLIYSKEIYSSSVRRLTLVALLATLVALLVTSPVMPVMSQAMLEMQLEMLLDRPQMLEKMSPTRPPMLSPALLPTPSIFPNSSLPTYRPIVRVISNPMPLIPKPLWMCKTAQRESPFSLSILPPSLSRSCPAVWVSMISNFRKPSPTESKSSERRPGPCTSSTWSGLPALELAWLDPSSVSSHSSIWWLWQICLSSR